MGLTRRKGLFPAVTNIAVKTFPDEISVVRSARSLQSATRLPVNRLQPPVRYVVRAPLDPTRNASQVACSRFFFFIIVVACSRGSTHEQQGATGGTLNYPCRSLSCPPWLLLQRSFGWGPRQSQKRQHAPAINSGGHAAVCLVSGFTACDLAVQTFGPA
jgi:hypothetical protein